MKNNILMKVKVAQSSVVSDSSRSHGLGPPGLLCLWEFSRREYWSELPCSAPGDLPNPGIEPKSPTRQTDSLLSESPGKAYNTRVGSLSLKKVPLRKFLKKGELLEQGAELGSPALQADSFPAELPGNHNNTF